MRLGASGLKLRVRLKRSAVILPSISPRPVAVNIGALSQMAHRRLDCLVTLACVCGRLCFHLEFVERASCSHELQVPVLRSVFWPELHHSLFSAFLVCVSLVAHG